MGKCDFGKESNVQTKEISERFFFVSFFAKPISARLIIALRMKISFLFGFLYMQLKKKN